MAALNLKTERFEGPLDLLLALITKNKIDIFDIPIAEIAEQYTEYIDGMRALDMEVTSDFIRMAAELMYIKSRMLLPSKEEEDPRKELVDSLLEYRRAKELAAFLKLQSEVYYDRFTKEPEPGDGVYTRQHAASLLCEAFAQLRAKKGAEVPQQVKLFEKLKEGRFYTVREKILHVIRLLLTRKRAGKRTEFTQLFEKAECKNEIIAVFLALLELVKVGRIDVKKQRGKLFLLLSETHAEVSV